MICNCCGASVPDAPFCCQCGTPQKPMTLADMVKVFLDWHKLTLHTVSVEWLKENLGRHQAGGGNIDLDFATSLKGIVFTRHGQRVEMTWARFVAYCRSLIPADEKPLSIYRADVAKYIPAAITGDTETMQYIVQALKYWSKHNSRD